PTTGIQVNPPPQGDGYTNMDVLSTDQGVIAYHSLNDGDYVVLSLDVLPGFGSFTEYNVPDNLPDTVCIWPYVAVDRNDRIHVVAHEYETGAAMPQRTIYTRSDDQGATWTQPVMIDTVFELATIVVASEVDDKVAIVYNHPTENPGGMNNIFYIESQDGVTWDWNDKHQVTDYYTNPEEDTISAFADNDALYDSQGNLHIVWNATWTVEGGYYVHAFLYHWSEATGITEISEHPEMDFTNCQTGGWNLPYAKMSIGVDPDDNLYFICTNFDNTDCSVAGFANGELYGTASNNGGASWGRMVNLTNSPTPDCWPMECDSDHWSSMAETVDDSIYILYINDKDAGGIPQTEGVATENPVMYLAVDKSVLLRVIGVDEDKIVEPTSFTLMQNYPNPFNASTTIEYVTKAPGQVELAVYNLVGEKVEVLADELMPAGEHTVTWDAGSAASGVYYYKLSTAEGTVAKRALLLK
ncbi:MAG: T9SS type A sorting domain-containing protein, partial [Candidatus Zixiibacteriota bacterium]